MDFEEMKNAMLRAQQHNEEPTDDEDEELEVLATWIR